MVAICGAPACLSLIVLCCVPTPICRGLGIIGAACCPRFLGCCSSSYAGGRILAICASNSAILRSASCLACLSVDSSSLIAVWRRTGAALCCRCSCATLSCRSVPAQRICSLDKGTSPASRSSSSCICARLSGIKSCESLLCPNSLCGAGCLEPSC